MDRFSREIIDISFWFITHLKTVVTQKEIQNKKNSSS